MAGIKRPRTRNQFRLSWERAANSEAGFETPMVKSKTFASRKQAERHVRILTSDEPWREWAPDKGPNDWDCCSGRYSDCGCAGLTCAEARDNARENLPPITWIRLEERKITSTPFVEIERRVLVELVEVK